MHGWILKILYGFVRRDNICIRVRISRYFHVCLYVYVSMMIHYHIIHHIYFVWTQCMKNLFCCPYCQYVSFSRTHRSWRAGLVCSRPLGKHIYTLHDRAHQYKYMCVCLASRWLFISKTLLLLLRSSDQRDDDLYIYIYVCVESYVHLYICRSPQYPSLYFLFEKDGLVLPYIVAMIGYFCFGVLPYLRRATHVTAPGLLHDGRPSMYERLYVHVSTCGMLVLHTSAMCVPPPPQYPHIHVYLFALYACGHFMLALAYTTYWQWTMTPKYDVVDNGPKPKRA